MKIVFVYEKNKSGVAKIIASMESVLVSPEFVTSRCELESSGNDLKDVMRSLSGVDLMVIGAEPFGWDGTISGEIQRFISSCPYIEGKKIVVFSLKKLFGDKKAVKKLMKAVEERGGFLFDFDIIAGESNAKAFAHRLKTAKK